MKINLIKMLQIYIVLLFLNLVRNSQRLDKYLRNIHIVISLQVVYRKGSAILLESDIMSVSENDHLLTCLQTRWPNIDIRWDLSILPSLN